MCRMYLVTAICSDIVFNMDVFVAANSPSEAAEMAQVFWEQKEWPEIAKGAKVRVFLVPTPVRMGVIGWGDVTETAHEVKEYA